MTHPQQIYNNNNNYNYNHNNNNNYNNNNGESNNQNYNSTSTFQSPSPQPSSSSQQQQQQEQQDKEEVRIVFPLNVDYLKDVLFKIQVRVPELVGCIYNEDKIKPQLTSNGKRQLIWLNITKGGIAKLIKEKCETIKFNNEPITITIKKAQQQQQPLTTTIINKNTVATSSIYTVKITAIQSVALEKFFYSDLRTELLRLSGNNNNLFTIRNQSVEFTIENPTQLVGIPNIQQYLHNFVIRLLQAARFVEYYCDVSKMVEIQKNLPMGVYLVAEKTKQKFGMVYLTALRDLYNDESVISHFKTKVKCSMREYNLFVKNELTNKNIQFKQLPTPLSNQRQQIIDAEIECLLKSKAEHFALNLILVRVIEAGGSSSGGSSSGGGGGTRAAVTGGAGASGGGRAGGTRAGAGGAGAGRVTERRTPFVIETTPLKFIQTYSSHLLKNGDSEVFEINKDRNDKNQCIIKGVTEPSKIKLEAELKKIQTVKFELKIVNQTLLKEDVKKQIEQYFEKLTTQFKVVSIVLTPQQMKDTIIVFFAILKNQENEKKIRTDLNEMCNAKSCKQHHFKGTCC